jgi:hypothetical protein
MFQYAFMRAVQQKYFPDAEIQLCFSKVEREARRFGWDETDSIADFDAPYRRVEDISTTFKQKLLIFKVSTILWYYKYIVRDDYEVNRERIEEKYKEVMTRNNILWHTYGYTEFDFSLLDPAKDILFYGFFESSKYFDEIRDILLNDFQPLYKENPANAEIYNAARSKNSVCVSIRRGDFVGERLHDVCKKNYFDIAIHEAFYRIPEPQLIFFSDDIDWVKQNIVIPEEYHPLYESGDDMTFEKMNMMRSCKHFIISNSTFSWWAQYLSTYERKIVFAPDRWLNAPIYKDVYEKSWKLISV